MGSVGNVDSFARWVLKTYCSEMETEAAIAALLAIYFIFLSGQSVITLEKGAGYITQKPAKA
jgi:hypothetical protein